MEGNDIQKVINFLKANGWECDDKDTYMHFCKSHSVGIDISEDEVVFIDDNGDFAHIPMNVYAVIGFVYTKRLLVPVIPDGI